MQCYRILMQMCMGMLGPGGSDTCAYHLKVTMSDEIGAGNQANEASLYSFPHIFQLPGLHSSELSGLVKVLSATIASQNQPELQNVASENLPAITRTLQHALAMPSAIESNTLAPVKS